MTLLSPDTIQEDATASVFLDCEEHIAKDFTWKEERDNVEKYAETYDHPIWKKYLNDGVQGTHGGMDYLELKAFYDALINNKPMPVDVYDAAAWMAITPLSEQSILAGGAPINIPDFTRGKWVLNKNNLIDNIDFEL